ncbi:killer cell lectin-like receptor subfamily B member 1B allele C isoform X2 [Colius striatus]|uniref:killer cell lectin-like receptor subfamily B member 1B allele C isoform X2 n=1 Tax=Colius striatus TaxID=57412 RepID=UPI002B1E71D8|nr:killer cell lectin-like receptor subfamily B member 1B allele C isoform X2 [Colius striatus]
MAGEVVYADLRHPGDGFSPAQKRPVFQGSLQQEARNVSQQSEAMQGGNSTCVISAMIRYFCEPQWDRAPALAGCKLCPRTWELHGDTCYQLSKEKGSWAQGKKDCETQRSQLVVIRDEKEKEHMRNITLHKPVWIGLTSCHAECRWVDNTPFDIQMFGPLQENEGMCATLKNQELDFDVCDNDQHWVCQKKPMNLPHPEAGDGEKCTNNLWPLPIPPDTTFGEGAKE